MIDLVADAYTIAQRIGAAVDRTVESLVDNRVNQEPAFTDRMLTRIEDAVNQAPETRVRWRARTLTDRGPGAEESVHGADFLGVFEATVAAVSVAKGFLAQAKMLEVGESLSGDEHQQLREQCRKMLARTPDAFVFLYGREGVRIVSAAAVEGAVERELDQLGVKIVADFFHDHFRCFIGDPALASTAVLPTPRVRRLSALLGVDRLLYIEAIGQ